MIHVIMLMCAVSRFGLPRGAVFSWRSGPNFGKMAVVAELAEAEKGGGGSGCVAPTVVDLYI